MNIASDIFGSSNNKKLPLILEGNRKNFRGSFFRLSLGLNVLNNNRLTRRSFCVRIKELDFIVNDPGRSLTFKQATSAVRSLTDF